MTEFLFFRHGETDWNLKRIFQGHTDIPLNETGIKQAQALVDKVRYWKPDIILSSDLTRALHTAEFCRMDWKVPIQTSGDLREMYLGDAEGLHRDDVMKLVGPDMWSKWLGPHDQDESFSFPNGETRSTARTRVLSHLEKFAKTNSKYKRIAVSTHGGILKRVTHGLTGVPPEGIPIPNCVTYRLNFDGYNWHFVKVRERASAIVVADNKILSFFGVDPHSGHEYHFLPGGLIETNETVYECAARESLEETGYEVTPHSEIVTSEYDFKWNNQDIWCRTHFVRADLKTDFQSPKKVIDADYNKGVRWVPVDDFMAYFDYNKSIVESIRKIISK